MYVSQWTYHTLQQLIWCYYFVTQISAVGIHIMFHVYKVTVWYDMVWYGIVGYNVRSTHYRSFRGRYSQPVTGLVQKLGLNQIKMWQSYDTRNLNNNKQQKTKHIQTKLHLMKLKPGLCVFLCCPARKWIGTILQLPRPVHTISQLICQCCCYVVTLFCDVVDGCRWRFVLTVQSAGANVLPWSCSCHCCVWHYTRGAGWYLWSSLNTMAVEQ